MDPKRFGQFIAAERAARGMTQKELAEKLGVTDVEVLRARRLPPEAKETTPPFLTWRQAGRLLLWWAAMTAALYGFDLRDMLGVSHIMPLGVVLLYLLPPAFAIPLALRDARGVARVDRRGVLRLWLILLPAVFLLILALEEGVQPLYRFMTIPDRLFGADRWGEQDYFYSRSGFGGGVRWELRWQLFWFLGLRFFNQDALFSIAETFGCYALAKGLKIRGNAKKAGQN